MDRPRGRLRTQLPEPLSDLPARRPTPAAGPTAPTATLTLPERYARELAVHGYQADAAQLAAAEQLERLRDRLLATARPLVRWLRPTAAPAGPRGLYLWGPVGRGKTWLMDLFFDSLGPARRLPRQRLHFHHFMRDVHAALHGLRRRRDPLETVAQRLATRVRLLCLDELYVSDIADAMLLGGLFTGLLERGVMLVTTSNVAPAELYRDGLQRARFLPTIALLERELEVLCVDGGTDYRLRRLQRRPIYLSSRDAQSGERLRHLFEELSDGPRDDGVELVLQGRKLRALRRRGPTVWFGFAALCEGPRSQMDYVELAREFQTVLLSEVPVFSLPQQDDAARRFIALVDELYDQGVKLILSAAAPPAELYRGERLQLEFRRTASRLMEMQTERYLARAHRPQEFPP